MVVLPSPSTCGVHTHTFMSVIDQNPRRYHEKAFANSVSSAGSDKINNFVGQNQNYDCLIVCALLSQVTRVGLYWGDIYSGVLIQFWQFIYI